MDITRYQFNGNNFEFLEEIIRDAEPLPENAYKPIPPQTINLILTHPLLLIAVSPMATQTTWTYGGMVRQKASTNIPGHTQWRAIVQTQKLWIGQWNVFIPSQGVNDWTLEFTVPKWFPRWQLLMYGYTGPISNDRDNVLSEILTAVTL